MGRDRLGGADGRAGFMPLRTISNFTYEMIDHQSETARDSGFRKHRHGCRCFRLVRLDTLYPFHL